MSRNEEGNDIKTYLAGGRWISRKIRGRRRRRLWRLGRRRSGIGGWRWGTRYIIKGGNNGSGQLDLLGIVRLSHAAADGVTGWLIIPSGRIGMGEELASCACSSVGAITLGSRSAAIGEDGTITCTSVPKTIVVLSARVDSALVMVSAHVVSQFMTKGKVSCSRNGEESMRVV